MSPDRMLPFLLEGTDVGGRLVRLRDTWLEVRRRTRYPAPVARVLGQALAAVALLSAGLKGSARLTLQVQAAGPVSLLVVQFVPPQGLRATAQWQGQLSGDGLDALFGKGRLALTLEPDARGERYQSEVDLVGGDLAAALTGYFERSDQQPAGLWLAAGSTAVGGLILQRAPAREAVDPAAWERSRLLADTLREAELLSGEPESLLRRLFAGQPVRVFEARPLGFACGCSRSRSLSLLLALGEADVRELLRERGRIEVTCEFCGARYRFSPAELDAMFRPADGLH